MTYWRSASGMPRRRDERACAPCLPKDGSVSFSPTRSIWRTRASQLRIPLRAGSNCCICLLFPVQSRRNSRTAPNSPLWRRAALCSITRISVPSPTTGCREWWRLQAHHIPLKVIHVTSREQAQNVPSPVTTYVLFRDGKFLTQGIQSDKKFLKLAGVEAQ